MDRTTISQFFSTIPAFTSVLYIIVVVFHVVLHFFHASFFSYIKMTFRFLFLYWMSFSSSHCVYRSTSICSYAAPQSGPRAMKKED
ncbi:hypothetical protein C8Q75DRAFT_562093 [Abortiporus biennis]|nr:hypothetical protein C8Q75DRAFT_562093 [Abortiporus biennis]